MSETYQVRRSDKVMPATRSADLIAHGFCGRLATVDADGWPYVVPLLYVWIADEIWVHNSAARGHFRTNVDRDPRVCFEIDQAGEVFPYGRFECDTSIAYQSVVAFGRIRIADDEAQKQAFFDAFMAKYGAAGWQRPKGFYPRLSQVTVYAITIERMTGKETPLPAPPDQWPAADHTKSPRAIPPR